jgi:membrane-associated phospholipid phosphatase
MDNILNSGIQIVLWVQSLGTWLTPIMKFFTFLGNEQFYLLVAPAILWCIDSTLGLRLGLFLMISGMVNTALKVAIHGPRPYWYSSKVTPLGSAETSFGAPSGHAQNSVIVWGTLADRIKKRWFWAVAIIIMFMIGLSRIYLALHFPHDVLLGWIVGAILLWLMLKLEKPVIRWLNKYGTGIQLLLIFLFSLGLILLVMIAQLSMNGWVLPAEWVNNAQVAFPEEPVINPLSFHNFLSSTGAFFGLAAGWIWITKQGGFTTKDEAWKLVLRYFLGVVGVLILYIGLGSLFTDSETFVSYSLRYIRYALIGFWMSGFAPWIFVKLKIARRRI